MYKFVFLHCLLLLVVADLACRVNGDCTEDGQDCILDENCCIGYCDWQLGIYPYSGICSPRPNGPIPPKPCIKRGADTCVYNVTCCEGYCERRFTAEGFCVIDVPPGYGEPPSEPPISIAPTISPTGFVIPPYDLPVASPTPAPLGKDGRKHNHAAPPPPRKNGRKHIRAAPPRPPPSRKHEHKLKNKRKHKNGKLKCTNAHAPAPT